MNQLEAIHQREHKDALYFWIPERANVEKRTIIASVLQMLFKLQRWYSTRPWIPHIHNKMKADEAYDGSGNGAADPIRIQRTPMQSRRH